MLNSKHLLIKLSPHNPSEFIETVKIKERKKDFINVFIEAELEYEF